MDKAQAIHEFWSSFGIPAYDEHTLPTGANRPSTPYITYSVSTGALNSILLLTASVWYHDTSWINVSEKVDEIAEKLGRNGFYIQELDDGYLWIVQGDPFAQRMSDPDDDLLRRIYLNVTAEFLTAY